MTAILPELPDTSQRLCLGCNEWWPDDAEFYAPTRRHRCRACLSEIAVAVHYRNVRARTEEERRERLRAKWREASRRARERADRDVLRARWREENRRAVAKRRAA